MKRNTRDPLTHQDQERREHSYLPANFWTYPVRPHEDNSSSILDERDEHHKFSEEWNGPIYRMTVHYNHSSHAWYLRFRLPIVRDGSATYRVRQKIFTRQRSCANFGAEHKRCRLW